METEYLILRDFSINDVYEWAGDSRIVETLIYDLHSGIEESRENH